MNPFKKSGRVLLNSLKVIESKFWIGRPANIEKSNNR